jgi:lipopolysaccharide export system protein LptC
MSSPTADLPGHDLPGHDRPGLAAEDVERRRRLLRQWRRHSALIAILRKLLPAACLAIIVALGAWSAMSTLLWRTDAKVRSNPEIRMLNPNFQGRTEAGKPFLMTAASAVRDNTDENRVTLEKPVLNLGVGTPEWTKVTAARGVYREDTRMLDLRGQVVLDDYKGNHLTTEHALVDTIKNNVDGDTRIAGHGPLGSIDASSYSLRDGGAYLLFQGRVKSRIYPQHQSPAAPAPAGH